MRDAVGVSRFSLVFRKSGFHKGAGGLADARRPDGRVEAMRVTLDRTTREKMWRSFAMPREPGLPGAHGESMNDFVGRLGDASVRKRDTPVRPRKPPEWFSRVSRRIRPVAKPAPTPHGAPSGRIAGSCRFGYRKRRFVPGKGGAGNVFRGGRNCVDCGPGCGMFLHL